MLVPSACTLTGGLPPTERAERMGHSSWRLPSVGSRKPLPVAGFLLPQGVVEETGNQEYRLLAWLDGLTVTTTQDLNIQWLLTTNEVSPDDSVVPPLSGSRSAAGTLDERPLAGQLLEAHLKVAGDWRVRLEVTGRGLSQTSIEFSKPRGSASPTWPGLLPGRTVPLDPSACDDPRFPRQIGTVHLGCSQSNDGRPLLDRRVDTASGRTFPIPPVAVGRQDPSSGVLRPGRASPSGGAFPGLMWWTRGVLGVWPALPPESGRSSLRLPKGELRGRPVSDGTRFAFARPDRVEVGDLGSWTRTILPAQPTDTSDVLALAGRWLARLDEGTGGTRLILRDLDRRREAVIPTTPRPSRPILAGHWLLWEDQAGLHGLPLQGGRAWTAPLRSDQAVPTTLLDDWLILTEQAGDSGGLATIHIPSGAIRRPEVEGDRSQIEPRGAGAGQLTLWERSASADKPLRVAPLAIREFSPRGVLAEGMPLLSQPPSPQQPLGRRSAAAWIPRGGERTITFDPGPQDQQLEAWVGQHDLPAAIDLEQGGHLVGRTHNLPTPSPTVAGHWVPLGVLRGLPAADSEERSVRLRWFAGDQSRTTSRLRLRPMQGQL